jgi:hypothetical protein
MRLLSINILRTIPADLLILPVLMDTPEFLRIPPGFIMSSPISVTISLNRRPATAMLS